jgi:hypothetical protein
MSLLHYSRLYRAASFAIALVLISLARAQTDFINFDYQGNHDQIGGEKVVIDKTGAIYVAGTGVSDSNGSDFVLTKYVLVGSVLTFQWSAPYDGPAHGDDTVTGLVIDASGNIYMSGYSQGSGTGYDAAVFAVDPSGATLWSAGDHAARYNSSGSFHDYARDLAIDGSGNLLVCGESEVGSGPAYDAFVVVFTPAGAVKTGWPKTYDTREATQPRRATERTFSYSTTTAAGLSPPRSS